MERKAPTPPAEDAPRAARAVWRLESTVARAKRRGDGAWPDTGAGDTTRERSGWMVKPDRTKKRRLIIIMMIIIICVCVYFGEREKKNGDGGGGGEARRAGGWG